MKLLVTGGAGFIGSALICHIIEHTEYSVVNLDRLSYAANLQALESVSDSGRYTFVQADICDRAAVKSVFVEQQPDAVLHLAGETHVDRSIDNPDLFVNTNIVGTHVMLEAAKSFWMEGKRANFRFLYVSTDEIYGSRLVDEKVDEAAPYRPNSPYACSKAAATHLVAANYNTYKMPTLITCCSNNYGPWQYPEKLIPVTINNAVNGRSIPVFGQGQAMRDWLYVDDHVKALLCVLEQGQPGLVYNINGGFGIRNIDLVERICQQLDQIKPLKGNSSYRDLITFVDDRRGHDRRYGIDDQRIRADLGWKPLQNFEGGLKSTILWNLDHIRP